MAKFTCPLSEEQFRKALGPEAKKVFLVLGDAEDPIGRAFSCIKHGWLSKMYHKDSMDGIKEENKMIRAKLKNNPELRKQIFGDVEAKLR